MADIQNKLDRKQIIRMDCQTCRGNGFFMKEGNEAFCEDCNGVGSREKEIPFRFETNGRLTEDEVKQEFEDSAQDFRPNTGL